MNINKKLKKYVYLAHLFKCLIVLFNLKNELGEKTAIVLNVETLSEFKIKKLHFLQLPLSVFQKYVTNDSYIFMFT